MEYVLPERISSERFLHFLKDLCQIGQDDEVIIDFSSLKWVSPAALVSLVATVIKWLKNKKHVTFKGLSQCEITEYLQRMDVLRICGIEQPESFIRRDSRGRFVPVRLVDHHVDDMAGDMAACLAPGGDEYEHEMADLYDLAWYVITETANNTRQHSCGLGYASAQVTSKEGLVRIAIADNGHGILQSFRDAGLPWSKDADDVEAITKALEPRVSSKFAPNNEGVGLTLVSGLARITGAWLLIVSGNGVVTMNKGKTATASRLPSDAYYQGTLVAMAFEQQKIRGFAEMLNQAKTQAGLLQQGGLRGRFDM